MRIIVRIDGVEATIAALSNVEEKMLGGLQQQIAALARDSLAFLKDITPVRTGRLRAGNTATQDTLGFTLENLVWYFNLVDEGHNTAAGYHTKRGYRAHKRRSHVAGRHITERVVTFVQQNAETYIARAVDNLPTEV